MKLLDLFCGAGGCSVGYYRAGFTEIWGVDIKHQKRYPFNFIKCDALGFLRHLILSGEIEYFDLIHASPPCQVHSVTWVMSNKSKHIDLLSQTRHLLRLSGRPYVIENVPGAPVKNPIMLCGTMFGLRVIRHRLFECSPPIWFPPATCSHVGRASGNRTRGIEKSLKNFQYITVAGNDYIADSGRKAMGIDWMTKKELSQAIPPAYTEYIGKKMIEKVALFSHPL